MLTRASPLPSLLHITNGDSTGNTLRQTALGGAVLSWQDVLHEGPVPAVPRPELLRTRADFLADCGWGSRQALLSVVRATGPAATRGDPRGAQVVLWFEHDLYDQLQLLDVLALARDTEDAAPELIVMGSFPGKPSFAGLGELTADELETLWPSRRRATPAALEAATSVWAALRRPSPTRSRSGRRGHSELPFLARALRRLLEELPAPTDGLSGTERRALQSVAAGALTPPAAFVAAQDSRRRRSSVTPGSTERYARSGRERPGSSKPATARHFLRRLRSATPGASRASSCG